MSEKCEVQSVNTSADYALGYAEGFNDACRPAQPQPKPVAWAMPRGDGFFLDVITPEEHARHEGEYTVALYAAQPAPVPADSKFADAHLAALLRYTGNFYSVAMERGLPAGQTANMVAHVESAARALHKLVLSAAPVPVPPGMVMVPDAPECVECMKCGHQNWIQYGKAPCEVVPPGIAASPQPVPVPVPLTEAAADVLAERKRQVEVEGWNATHDDEHGDHSMSIAAACYALADRPALEVQTVNLRDLWLWTGWSPSWFKPKDRRRNLIRAAALMLAEIERLDRAGIAASPEVPRG